MPCQLEAKLRQSVTRKIFDKTIKKWLLEEHVSASRQDRRERLDFEARFFRIFIFSIRKSSAQAKDAWRARSLLLVEMAGE